MKRDIKELAAMSTITSVLEYVLLQDMVLEASLLARVEKAINSYDGSDEDFSSVEYLTEVLTAACEVLEAKNG